MDKYQELKEWLVAIKPLAPIEYDEDFIALSLIDACLHKIAELEAEEKQMLELEDVEWLPEDSVLLDKANYAWQLYEGKWCSYGMDPISHFELVELYSPLRILWGDDEG